jgi:hypothetical protein
MKINHLKVAFDVDQAAFFIDVVHERFTADENELSALGMRDMMLDSLYKAYPPTGGDPDHHRFRNEAIALLLPVVRKFRGYSWNINGIFWNSRNFSGMLYIIKNISTENFHIENSGIIPRIPVILFLDS